MTRCLAALLLFAWIAPAQATGTLEITLSYAFHEMHERALSELPVSAYAVEGLKGLAALDPAISISAAEEGSIQLRFGEARLATYPRPKANDSLRWAKLIGQIADRAAQRSPAIAHAGQDRLVEAILDASLARLDIFSHYAGPAEARERRAARSGFGGIGVRYDKAEGGIVLTEVMPESPAAEAGLKLGDLVTAIDGVTLADLGQTEISQHLRGPVPSVVLITVDRHNGAPPKVITLHRSLIVPPTVTLSVEDGVARVAITSFNQNTGQGVADAVRKARAAPGFKGIILDMRGNPGGILDQGIMVADQFVAHGRILSRRGRHPDAAESRDAAAGEPGEGVPLVVLIDGGTASAAEIVAADLQDLAHAVLVGTNSFGKGAIQTVLPLPNDGELALTWSRFYTPSGYALHGLGVLPAICTAAGPVPVGDHALAAGHAAPPSFFAAWRAAPADDMARRTHLRTHCAAADHAANPDDLAIAKALLTDKALFSQAQSVAGPVSTASVRSRSPAAVGH